MVAACVAVDGLESLPLPLAGLTILLLTPHKGLNLEGDELLLEVVALSISNRLDMSTAPGSKEGGGVGRVKLSHP